jgi:hypothetical protein
MYKSVKITIDCITVYTLQKSYKSPRKYVGSTPHFFPVVFSRSARTDRLKEIIYLFLNMYEYKSVKDLISKYTV